MNSTNSTIRTLSHTPQSLPVYRHDIFSFPHIKNQQLFNRQYSRNFMN